MTLRLTFAALGVCLGVLMLPGTSRSDSSMSMPLGRVQRAERFIAGLDLDDARRELAEGNPDDPAIAIEKGRLALYEADCDGASAFLAREEVQKTPAGKSLADVARGCARVIAATWVERDEGAGVEVRYQDEIDRPLTPLIVATAVAARDALTRDLGVQWPFPTRIIIVRDLLSLSAMTGLSKQAAETTGTVAVAKWGRVTLLSPRAVRHGYTWRDTLAHELTHLAVTRVSRDRAPLWLQEGIAKNEETRWREAGPFDDRPAVDSVVRQGMARKLDLPLDQLGPSIAMLPSAEAAMVAFAEVTSFVHFVVERTGPRMLGILLRELGDSKNVNEALQIATGADRKEWDLRWRKAIVGEKLVPLPSLFGGSSAPDRREPHERTRLAELLLGRGHPSEALVQLDHIKTAEALDDPSLRVLRAGALEALGQSERGSHLFTDPKELTSNYGLWWVVRGRFARQRGDQRAADASFLEAVGLDPLDRRTACQPPDDATKAPIMAIPGGGAAWTLCDAARLWAEPNVGQD